MGYEYDDQYDRFRELIAEQIANVAAPLVASRECTRAEAIEKATNYVRALQEADSDVTGTLETMPEAQCPEPSRKIDSEQIFKVKAELMDLAQEASEDF